jgi:hypothetical protein
MFVALIKSSKHDIFFRMHLLLGGQTSGIIRLGWGQTSGICPIFGGVKPPEWWGQTKTEWWGQYGRNTHRSSLHLRFARPLRFLIGRQGKIDVHWLCQSLDRVDVLHTI